ncbi:hypothetical protein P885DRAFT_57485 [Corynascus similis CBS 632.67]
MLVANAKAAAEDRRRPDPALWATPCGLHDTSRVPDSTTWGSFGQGPSREPMLCDVLNDATDYTEAQDDFPNAYNERQTFKLSMYTPGCRGPEKKDLELAARCVTKARGSTEMTGHKAAQTEIRFTSVSLSERALISDGIREMSHAPQAVKTFLPLSALIERHQRADPWALAVEAKPDTNRTTVAPSSSPQPAGALTPWIEAPLGPTVPLSSAPPNALSTVSPILSPDAPGHNELQRRRDSGGICNAWEPSLSSRIFTTTSISATIAQGMKERQITPPNNWTSDRFSPATPRPRQPMLDCNIIRVFG